MSNGCTDMRKTDRKGLDSAGDGAVTRVWRFCGTKGKRPTPCDNTRLSPEEPRHWITHCACGIGTLCASDLDKTAMLDEAEREVEKLL